MQSQLNHFDEQGNAVMVDVSAKNATLRTATAQGKITMSADVLRAIVDVYKRQLQHGAGLSHRHFVCGAAAGALYPRHQEARCPKSCLTVS